MEKTATNKKNKNKKPIIAISIIIIIILLIASLFTVNNKEEKTNTITEKWNSDKNLIDDRLPENYPIMFITSPSSSDNVVAITTLCLYNNGKYVTAYFVSDTIDTYLKESTSSSAFIDILKDSYEENIETDIANLLTSDLKPSDVRKYYLNQYKIEDFSLSSIVNMSDVSDISFNIYGVTYEETDDGLVGTSHKYYSEDGGTTQQITDETGIDILEWFLNTENSEYSENTETN